MSKDFEQELLRNPFDLALRTQFAGQLFTDRRIAEAIEQYRLVLGQNEHNLEAGLGLCRSLMAQAGTDEFNEAKSLYARLKNEPGFDEQMQIEELEQQAQRLSVLSGREHRVVEFPRDTKRIRFDDIVGMHDLKKSIRLTIIEPFRNPELFKKFKKKAGTGILLYGPPGCGKTMTAKAVATECGAIFLPVGLSDVLNMWMGESEANLAEFFEKARSETPSVLFFDELDALAYSRSKSQSDHARTLVNEFLAQLDGVQNSNDNILILAATNMPWDVDPAMKRPGRFSKQIFVPPPDAEARADIFRKKLSGIPVGELDFAALAAKSNLYSGADIDGVIDGAKESALMDMLDGGTERPLRQDDFEHALRSAAPSTIDWLKTARNLVKYSGRDSSYKEVAKYLKANKLH